MADCGASNSVNSNANTDTDEIVEDLPMLHLENDSFAICELCGYVGIRKYFRSSKYCCQRCKASASLRRNVNWKFTVMGSTDHMAGYTPLEPLPQLQTWTANLTDLQAGPIKQSAALVVNSYQWKEELFGCDFLAAPVSLFKHALLQDMWDNTFEGMKVEVRNTDCKEEPNRITDYFWVATVLKVKGYMGMLRYEGFGSDDSKDFWVNLCCSEVHPVGWIATRGKPLIPPISIENKYTDWKKFLTKQLTGARTLPINFYSKLAESLKSRFSVGNVMEIVDKNRISQVKVASVHEIVGKRLHIKYYDTSAEDNGFWCHEDSPLIHPVGWAFRVGHPLDAPESYCQRVATGRLLPKDTTREMFYNYPSTEPPLFSEGMKLEAIDPLNLSSICAATVMQILHEGYMMIRIDCYPADISGADWFCYHQRSPCIFPVGFSLANNIPLVPPNGWTVDEFSWERYLESCGGRAAPAESFAARSHTVGHGFVQGMRLECADLMDPRLVCVATVARVVADLLKVHFDGWGDEYDQWLWAHSTDMYPVGWCRAVGHRLEGPMQAPPRPPRQPRRPKPPKPVRRRRRLPATVAPNSHTSTTTEDSSQNSDITELKSVSPTTSVSETSMEIDPKGVENGDKKSTATIESLEMDLDVSNDQKSDSSRDLPLQSDQLSLDPPSSDNLDDSYTIPDQSEPSPQDPTDKVIPRLVNNANVPLDVFNLVDPENWTTEDVTKFLTVNDCQPYCVNFSNITGSMMLQLSKDEIIELLEMKVGPSLKIFDLIQQLKFKIKQPKGRLLGSFK